MGERHKCKSRQAGVKATACLGGAVNAAAQTRGQTNGKAQKNRTAVGLGLDSRRGPAIGSNGRAESAVQVRASQNKNTKRNGCCHGMRCGSARQAQDRSSGGGSLALRATPRARRATWDRCQTAWHGAMRFCSWPLSLQQERQSFTSLRPPPRVPPPRPSASPSLRHQTQPICCCCYCLSPALLASSGRPCCVPSPDESAHRRHQCPDRLRLRLLLLLLLLPPPVSPSPPAALTFPMRRPRRQMLPARPRRRHHTMLCTP